IAPPAGAYLLTDRLPLMIGLSAALGAAAALAGYWTAHALDASIAGSMAGAAGVLFLGCLLFAPERGLVAQARRRAGQRVSFAALMLAIHLLNHEDQPDAAEESEVAHLQDHLRWTPAFARQ